MDTINILKKRGLDIVLVGVVIGLFFFSGKKELSEEADKITNENIPVSNLENNKNEIIKESKPSSTPFAMINSNAEKPAPLVSQRIPNQKPPSDISNNVPTTFMTPNPNPYQELKDSFSQMGGGTITTEAIIERNTYFKKLSEQLQELQGEVSTDSTQKDNSSPNDLIRSDEFSNQNIPADSNLEDPELLDEIFDSMSLTQ